MEKKTIFKTIEGVRGENAESPIVDEKSKIAEESAAKSNLEKKVFNIGPSLREKIKNIFKGKK